MSILPKILEALAALNAPAPPNAKEAQRRARRQGYRTQSYLLYRKWKAVEDNERRLVFVGQYHANGQTFPGRIEIRYATIGADHISYDMQHPPTGFKKHSKKVCFQSRGNHWYRPHFHTKATSLDEGIVAMETLLRESLAKS